MHQSVDSTTWDGIERRRFERKKAVTNARIRRISPPNPELMNVYTIDLTPFGACFTVKDSIIYKKDDMLRVTFVIRLNEKVIRTHFRLSKVVWAKKGRMGVQFQFDEHGMPLK